MGSKHAAAKKLGKLLAAPSGDRSDINARFRNVEKKTFLTLVEEFPVELLLKLVDRSGQETLRHVEAFDAMRDAVKTVNGRFLKRQDRRHNITLSCRVTRLGPVFFYKVH